MANLDFDDDDYINTAGMGPRLLPVQATELLGGIGSQILRSLLVAAPGNIPEEYACSPEEAALALACCDLAELPAWDEVALLDAATVGGNEEERVMWGLESRDRLARRISLAMKAEKAPEVMSPAAGALLLRRAGIDVFGQLLDAVAWLQLGSDATLPNYRLLKGIAVPPATPEQHADTVALVTEIDPAVGVSDAVVVVQKAKRKTPMAMALPYLREVYHAGKFRTAQVFINSLASKSGLDGSPFKKASTTDDAFYLIENGKTIPHATLKNQMEKVRKKS